MRWVGLSAKIEDEHDIQPSNWRITDLLTLRFVKRAIALILLATILNPTASAVHAQNPDSLKTYYQGILNTYQQELAKLRQQPDPPRWQEIDILNGAGIAYRYLGQYQQSVTVLEQALAIARAITDRARETGIIQELAASHSKLGDDFGIDFLRQDLQQARQRSDRKSEAIVLRALGLAYLQIGNYVATAETLENYLKFLEPTQDAQEIALVKSMLAASYGQLKDKPQQLQNEQQQLAIAQQSQDKSAQQNALTNLAFNYRAQANYPKALETFQTLLELAQKQQDEQMETLTLQWMAGIYIQLKQPDKAIAALEQGLAIARRSNNLFHIAWLTKSLGRVYFLIQQYKAAQTAQQQAIALFRQVYNKPQGSSSEAEVMVHLALTLSKQGQWAEAERLLRQSQQMYDFEYQEIGGNANLLDISRDDLNLSLYEAPLDSYRLLQQVLVAQNQSEAALEVAEAGRAKAFAQLLATRLAANPAAQLTAPPLSLAQIRQLAKAQNTTLVEYSILYDDLRVADFTLGNLEIQPAQLFVWVIRPTGQITFRRTDLKPLQQQNLPLRDLVRDARRNLGALGRGETLPVSGDRPPIEQNLGGLKRLHQLLIEPIADLLPTDPTARITFIPQDALFLAPFAALQDRNGRYLIEQHTILLAPSIQALALLNQRRSKLAIAKANALVVGNPTMPKLQLNPKLPPTSLPDLPGAEAEARAISELLHTQPLIGSQATEVAITQKIGQAEIVHLATHGILDNIRGLQSSLALASTGNQTAATDGFLTAREVLKLNLKANLVVLSACDTGRGTINGDGVVGLSRSFMAAGTPSLVVSLWAVPDTPTAELMKRFYLNLGQGMDKAQALRQAMLSTMKQHPKPLDWAGFILLGVAE